jgi:predicted AAA+ superfamily ATPase
MFSAIMYVLHLEKHKMQKIKNHNIATVFNLFTNQTLTKKYTYLQNLFLLGGTPNWSKKL